MIIVLDTDVWIAALRSPHGASRLLVQRIREGKQRAAVSVPLFLEYEAVAKRPAQLSVSGLSTEDIDTLLAVLAARMEPVARNYLWRPQLDDPADEMVLEAAINGRANHLLTFNVAHFAVAARRFGIKATTPGEFVRSQPWPEQAILH